MAAPAEVDIGTLIERRPDVYSGHPVLKGTRFPVIQLAVLYQQGADAAEIHRRFPQLDPALIHAGIAYYLANREAIEQALAEEHEHYQRDAAENPGRSPRARRQAG